MLGSGRGRERCALTCAFGSTPGRRGVLQPPARAAARSVPIGPAHLLYCSARHAITLLAAVATGWAPEVEQYCLLWNE